MLKHRVITLSGKDDGVKLRLTELPALLADRAARVVLARLGEDLDGGVAALAFKHSSAALKLGVDTLLPFVQATRSDLHELDIRRDIKDWRNIERLQHAALLLHVDFPLGRQTLEIPLTLQAQNILAGAGAARANFCSPQIAAVLSDRMATYRELETVLSTEDVFNLCELLNVNAIRDWHAQQATQ